MSELKLRSFKIEDEFWTAFKEWCYQHRTDASKELNRYIKSLVSTNGIDNNDATVRHKDSNDDSVITSRWESLEAKIEKQNEVITLLTERIAKLEQLETEKNENIQPSKPHGKVQPSRGK